MLRATGPRTAGRFLAAGAAVIVVAGVLTGCFPAAKHVSVHAARKHSASSASGSPTASPTASASPSATPTVAPDPAISHLATPEPVSVAAPAPTLTPLPQGTVVAEADVASPKGSIHFHYRMIANGNNTYSAQYSGFTSTLPVPVSVTLVNVAPRVGDGLTYHGVGDHSLGGATSTAAPTSTVALAAVGNPSYLGTLVTYSSASSANGVPTELGPNKVLAVNSVHWAIPARQTNVHPTDGGSRAFASGKVTATTASGAPKRYLIAPGDITSVVAKRFGISIEDLIWLNKNLQVFGSQQYLYENTTLNLDPQSL